MKNLLTLGIILFGMTLTFAQNFVQGKITDENGNELFGVNISILESEDGGASDKNGEFKIETSKDFPLNILVTSVGFDSQTIVVNSSQSLLVYLEEGSYLDEIIVSASRTPEKIKESPVTIETFSLAEIKNSTSPTFYDAIENLKGVDLNTNSLTFKSVNTRGFATFANTRFMQLVDGMDNSSPALNFALGNLLGINELDVQSVEILPGASSALYGANAFNGIMLMNSKNPFDHTGISVYAKTGLTSSSNAGDNLFRDTGIRAAYKFSEQFAAKASFSWLDGTEWYATDYRDFNNPNLTRLDPGYDGLNVYGDEVSTVLDLDELAAGAIPIPTGTNYGKKQVSRTGYNEVDLMNYNAESVKTDFSLNFRPWENDFEIVWNSKIGIGNTIYQGANRYSIKDFFMQQHKLEIRNKNFFVRGYVTQENAGNSYDSRFTAININREWKDDVQWFTDYATGFIGSLAGADIPVFNATEEQKQNAHQAARAFADQGRYLPGTEEFKQAFNKVTSDSNLATGSKFEDQSQLRHIDYNYNFSHLINVVDIMVGGSFREYGLNSGGTIYTDYDESIKYQEQGAYIQGKKSLLEDKLKLTASIRYDKSELFDGYFSPRAAAIYSLDTEEKHLVRASYQTGFRNPTTQDLFIGLDLGRAILVGSADSNLNRYTSTPQNVSPIGQGIIGTESITLNGQSAYNNSFSLVSVNNGTYQQSDVSFVKPEQVTAYEIGYRGILNENINIDFSAYFNQYEDFISNKTVIVPYYGQTNLSDTLPDGTPLALVALANDDFKAFQTYTNTDSTINSFGASIGINTKILNDYNIGLNYTYAEQDFDQASDPDFETSFNTPKHRIKASLGKNNVIENLGFNLNYRWNDSYLWQSTFADGIISSRHIVDAQINYSVPKIKSNFKLGGANILGYEYVSAPGSGLIGAQYYISWTINQ